MKSWFEPGDLNVKVISADEAAPLLRLMYEVSAECGWAVERQLDDYLDDSVFFVAWRDGELVGGIKLVLGNAKGLPIDECWPETNLVGRTDVADLSLLALRSSDRGNMFVMGSLLATLWRYCLDHGIRELWAKPPVRNYHIYRRFGFPLERMGETRVYWGGPRVPSRIIVDPEHDVMAEKAKGSALYRKALGTLS